MKTILVDAFKAFFIKGEGIFEDMHKMLEEFPNRKIILTNANKEEMEQNGFRDMPYEVFTLNHDPEKSDPKYYEILLSRFNLNPEEVVLFEHKHEACKSAESIGIKTYFYDEEKKDLQSLKKFLEGQL